MRKADKALWMDMRFTIARELLKEENTKDKEKWCSRVFFTLVKAGVGTKTWWMLCVVGKAGTWI